MVKIAGRKKLFVLDTNVLLHDPQSLVRFGDNDVYIPFVTVEELDNKKVGSGDLNRNARSAIRMMDGVMDIEEGEGAGEEEGEDGVSSGLEGGFSLREYGEGLGRMYVQTRMVDFLEGEHIRKNDNMYLAVLKWLQVEMGGHDVVMVTKDLNLRIKARAFGFVAEDYKNDQLVEDAQFLSRGIEEYEDGWFLEVEGVESRKEGSKALYSVGVGDILEEGRKRDPLFKGWVANTFLRVAGGGVGERMYRVLRERAGRYELRVVVDYRVEKNAVLGLKARTHEQAAALELLMDPEVDFAVLLGPAGTGKTLLTVAAAFEQMRSKKDSGARYERLLFTRATIPLGEDVGFLPGSEEEKMLPWVGALHDNIEVLNEACAAGGKEGVVSELRELEKGKVEVKAMTFMRGRTLNRRVVVIDEAQNLTPKQMRALITRAGDGTKVVCLGNLAQIDSPYLSETSSGLTYVVEKFRGWEHFGALILEQGERSRLANEANERLK